MTIKAESGYALKASRRHRDRQYWLLPWYNLQHVVFTLRVYTTVCIERMQVVHSGVPGA